MSAYAYIAFQLGSPEILLHWFFSNLEPLPAVEGSNAGEASRDVAQYVAAVAPSWKFSRQAVARGGSKKKPELGVQPLPAQGRVALWYGAANVCHVLVCDVQVNVELGINFLQVFAAVLADHCKGGATETFLVKPDEAMVLLDKFLPCGRLLVLCTNLIKELKLQADLIIMDKKS